MREQREYTIENVRRVCSFTRADLYWGHRLEVKIYDETGALLNRVAFACHPEHAGYEDLQAKTTEELIAIAMQRLSSGQDEEALQRARQHGLVLCFSLSTDNS
jgi:hypothetical protein